MGFSNIKSCKIQKCISVMIRVRVKTILHKICILNKILKHYKYLLTLKQAQYPKSVVSGTQHNSYINIFSFLFPPYSMYTPIPCTFVCLLASVCVNQYKLGESEFSRSGRLVGPNRSVKRPAEFTAFTRCGFYSEQICWRVTVTSLGSQWDRVHCGK